MDDAPLRCFVALPVPASVRAALLDACAPLRREPWAGAVRWLAGERFHLTLRFLGDVDRARLAGLTAALDACASRAPAVVLTLEAVTGLPSGTRARVLVAALDAPPGLTRLVDALDAELVRAGFEPERRRLRPHITVARVRRPPLRAKVDVPLAPCPFAAEELQLVQSRLGPGGARYEALHRAALAPALD